MEENVIETAQPAEAEVAAPVEAAPAAAEQQPAPVREAREPRETRERPAKRNFKKQSRKVCIFCQEKAAQDAYGAEDKCQFFAPLAGAVLL